MEMIRGTDLRAMRRVAGLTTQQMANIAGVKTRKTYENWEKNVGTPNVNQFFALVEGCGMTLNELNDFRKFLKSRQRK